MTATEIKDQATDYLKDKIRSPYFAAMAVVWVISNRILVFGLFSFTEDESLPDKLEFIGTQLENFRYSEYLFGWSGFYATLVWAALWAFPAMIIGDALKAAGRIVYSKWEILYVKIMKFFKVGQFVDRSKYNTLQKKYDELSDKWGSRSTKIESLEKQVEDEKANVVTANDKIKEMTAEHKAFEREKKSELVQKDKTISNLTKENTKVENMHAEMLDERDRYRDRLQGLVQSNIALELLSGEWLNSHTYPDGRPDIENVVIEDNKYFVLVDGKKVYRADIENPSFDSEDRSLQFVKSRLKNFIEKESAKVYRGKLLFNDLQLSEDGNTLTGMEDGQISITYERVGSGTKMRKPKERTIPKT